MCPCMCFPPPPKRDQLPCVFLLNANCKLLSKLCRIMRAGFSWTAGTLHQNQTHPVNYHPCLDVAWATATAASPRPPGSLRPSPSGRPATPDSRGRPGSAPPVCFWRPAAESTSVSRGLLFSNETPLTPAGEAIELSKITSGTMTSCRIKRVD